jgi:SAM-dependent methyltransferase
LWSVAGKDIMKNIEYTSKQIKEFYSKHRNSWKDFYPSERWVFERLLSDDGMPKDVLDVGCACGGLGQALSRKFSIHSYTGVDINKEAIEWAKERSNLSCPHKFIAGDILTSAIRKKHSFVVSLGCADWNIETNRMIKACWDLVRPGGYFVVSLRLTDKQGINNIKRSYQHIKFDDKKGDFEIANYVVFDFSRSVKLFKKLNPGPELIGAYGYWGKPSASAVTPFKDLVFSVFYIKKPVTGFKKLTQVEFNLPADIF